VLQLCHWKFSDNETLVFGRNFCGKNDKFGYLNPILGKLVMTHDLGRWLVGKPMVDFLFALIELFAIY